MSINSSGNPSSLLVLREEIRERFFRAVEYAKHGIHYGWIPFIIAIGNAKI